MVIYMNPLLEELLDRYSMLPVQSNFQSLTSDFVFFFGIEHLKILGLPNFDPHPHIPNDGLSNWDIPVYDGDIM
jgi:hypothetical protein